MTILVMLFVIYFGAVLQSAMPGSELLGHAKVPFLLMAVLYYSLTRGRGVMLFAAVLAGLFQDALSQIPLGYSSLCFCLLGIAARRFKDVVFTESVLTAGFFGAVAATAHTIMCGFLLRAAGAILEPVWQMAWRTGGAALLGTVFTPIAFIAILNLERIVGNVPPKRDLADENAQYV